MHIRDFDAGDEAAVQAVVDDAVGKYGRLDVFFANAGVIGQPVAFTDIDGEGFMDTLRTNTLGFVFIHIYGYADADWVVCFWPSSTPQQL